MAITPHWITEKVYGFDVEIKPMPRRNNQTIRTIPESTGRLVLHSTEGMPKWTGASWTKFLAANPGFLSWRTSRQNTAVMKAIRQGLLVYRFDNWTRAEEEAAFLGAIRTLTKQFSAPTFVIGANRIAQNRQIGQQGAALLDPSGSGIQNGRAFIQIEASGNTEGRKTPWLFTDGTLVPLVACLAYCNVHYGIPLRVPNNYPDDLTDCPLPWAVATNRRRQDRAWETEQGIFMHLEVDQNNHFDCALLRRTLVVEMAKRVVLGMSPKDAVSSVREGSAVRPAEPAPTRTHTVKQGEGLWAIAKSENVPLDDLLRANGLTINSIIQPGQKLKIP